jgi:hypothetical protein
MTTTVASEPTTFRWSSTTEADRLPVEDPATRDVIAKTSGGGLGPSPRGDDPHLHQPLLRGPRFAAA